MAARDGEHVDAGEWKSVNLSPCLAIRFRFGVLFAFSPGLLASRSSQPISSASMMMKLGLFLGFSTLAPCWDTVQSSSPHSSIPDRTKRVKASAILGQTEMSVSMPLHTDHMSRCSDKVCSPEDNGVGGFGSTFDRGPHFIGAPPLIASDPRGQSHVAPSNQYHHPPLSPVGSWGGDVGGKNK